MPEISELLEQTIAASVETLHSLRGVTAEIEEATDAIARCFADGRKLLVCGNGGSAADAAHFAAEFVVRFTTERRGYPAICLSSDGGILSAAGNDYGFEEVFARQVGAYGQSGDVLLCLTTSGKSRNVLRALAEGKARGLRTIAFLGGNGGDAAGAAEIELTVRGTSTARIQEAHMLLLHVICAALDERLAGS